jgi:hypothetical protein
LAPGFSVLRAPCSLLLALCSSAEAQQAKKVHRIGLLHSASGVDGASFIDAFRHGARELGYVEGKNLALEIRWGRRNATDFTT